MFDGKAIAIIQVPTQRLFKRTAAARYLGVSRFTLDLLTQEKKIPAFWMRHNRVYRLDDLDRYIESLEEYCRTQNRRPDFKVQALVSINRILGKVPIRKLTRADANLFVAIRSKEVAPATVNRGIAVLKNLFTFAVEQGIICQHPLHNFRKLPEAPRALRVLTVDEVQRLIECVYASHPVIGAYTAVLAETGIRKSEGLSLRWEHVDLQRRLLTLERTKSGKVRSIPLTQSALRAFRSVIRIVGSPWVFVKDSLGRPWKDPRGPFFAGREAAGLEWVGFHDLRHFRASQWVRLGMDIRSVQELLGHDSIVTTQRYAHFDQDHASHQVERIEEIEHGGKVEALSR